jgi:hypothetical protein
VESNEKVKFSIPLSLYVLGFLLLQLTINPNKKDRKMEQIENFETVVNCLKAGNPETSVITIFTSHRPTSLYAD